MERRILKGTCYARPGTNLGHFARYGHAFLLQKGEQIIPIEVKAEENLRAKSLRQFVQDHEGTHGLRLSMSPYRKQDWMDNIPLYLAERAR